MLLERTLSTLQALGNERLQLPIFYESPLSLRFEIGPEDIPVNDPRYFRMAYWRTSFPVPYTHLDVYKRQVPVHPDKWKRRRR